MQKESLELCLLFSLLEETIHVMMLSNICFKMTFKMTLFLRLQEKMLLKWCRGLFFHIYHWNFAINFFLYYLTGKKFRGVVTQALKNHTNSHLPCHKRCNCHKHLTMMRSSNALLTRAVMRSKFVEDNITRSTVNERNSNAV